MPQSATYRWLLLDDGTTVIGTKGNDRTSWAVLYPDGNMGAINDKQVIASKPAPEPNAVVSEITTLQGQFQ